MSALAAILAFYTVTVAFALAGYPLVRSFAWSVGQSWLAARLVGMVAVAYPAWLAGLLGAHSWQIIALVLLSVAALIGIRRLSRECAQWREVVQGELVFLLGSGIVLWLRLKHPEILGTEKPMDLAILSGLLRTLEFPPPDTWFAGEPLPYYYWGALLWVVPIKASGIHLSEAYNLVAAALGGVTLSLAFGLGSALAGNRRSGALAAFLLVLAGTPDGLRQLAVKRSLGEVSLWESSRQDPSVITEFPLFSLWLGDLHPHLLSMPIALLALALALACSRGRSQRAQFGFLCIVVGIVGMTNPWALLPTLVACALLLVVGDGQWHAPWRRGRARWLSSVALAAGAFVTGAPFFVAYDPPVGGIDLVNAHTSPRDLLWYGGVLLLPVAGSVFADLKAPFADAAHGLLAALLAFAAAVILAALSGTPALVLLALLAIVLLVATVSGSANADRPAIVLALVGTMLFLIPELVYVVDAYGERLHRMNTVFKFYHQGWMLLALVWPVLLRRWLGTSLPGRYAVVIGAAMLTLPHLLVALSQRDGESFGLDGFRWMSAGDRAVVEFLRTQPPGTVIAEAIGAPYSEYARISAASGVPTYLGWLNHELVWRGPQIRQRLERRERMIAEIYDSGDAKTILRIIREANIDYVVVGALERARYSKDALSTLVRTGSIALEAGDTILLTFEDEP